MLQIFKFSALFLCVFGRSAYIPKNAEGSGLEFGSGTFHDPSMNDGSSPWDHAENAQEGSGFLLDSPSWEMNEESGSNTVFLDQGKTEEGSAILMHDVIEGSGQNNEEHQMLYDQGKTEEGSGQNDEEHQMLYDQGKTEEGSGILMHDVIEGSGQNNVEHQMTGMESQNLEEAANLNIIHFDNAAAEGADGSGNEGPNLNFINFQDQHQQPSQTHEEHEISVTKDDVDTLIIKVHLPTPSTNSLLEDLRDDTLKQTDLPDKLDVAVSLTSMLNDILERIQTSSTNE